MINQKEKQNQYKTLECHGQLVLVLNSEIMIPENAPVRLTSAQLEELDYSELYHAHSPRGRKSAADARVLFKVLVYGYQCGIYSSRKLEEACRYRIDFMWLLEDKKASDHSTLSRFRTGRCRSVVEDLFYQYVRKLKQDGEVDHGAVLKLSEQLQADYIAKNPLPEDDFWMRVSIRMTVQMVADEVVRFQIIEV